MKYITIVAANNIRRGQYTGCGECQTSCQSACKTSCTVANQSCKNTAKVFRKEAKGQ